MIKYIGSKRRLLPHLLAVVDALPGVQSVLDLFSGTSRVGHALKARGYDVTANDHNAYAWVLARCYVAADRDRVLADAGRWIERLAAEPPRAGWFTATYAEEARFLRPENAARLEGMREALAAADLDGPLEAVLLTSLMEAADRVDSTTGVQMAYLKSWAPRAHKPLTLRMPDVLPGTGHALCEEAAAAADRDVDLVYLDPPYNQHSYRGNYHVWETLVRWDRPETYGVARKRVDCRTYRSPFNRKRDIQAALAEVVARTRSRYVVLSFNDEGYLSDEALEDLLASHGHVRRLEFAQPRYVGARIGIHNPQGQRVGTVGRLENRERLYVLARDAADLRGLPVTLGSAPTRS